MNELFSHEITYPTTTQLHFILYSPQVITGSHDFTIRLWDLAAGKTTCKLTHHKKSVRALAAHPELYMFASGAPDNIKQWKCPNGEFVQVRNQNDFAFLYICLFYSLVLLK